MLYYFLESYLLPNIVHFQAVTSGDEEEAYQAVRFWRNATDSRPICNILLRQDMIYLLSTLSKMHLDNWPNMQSDVVRLISNVCAASKLLASQLVKELSNSLDQPAVLQALFQAHEEYSQLVLHQGAGLSLQGIKWQFPREWLDCDLVAASKRGVALHVPSHMTLADVTDVVFASVELKPEQMISVGARSISIDGHSIRISDSVALWNTVHKVPIDGELWEIGPGEILLRHDNHDISAIPVAQLRSGETILLMISPPLTPHLQTAAIKTVCLLQPEGLDNYERCDVVCHAPFVQGMPISHRITPDFSFTC